MIAREMFLFDMARRRAPKNSTATSPPRERAPYAPAAGKPRTRLPSVRVLITLIVVIPIAAVAAALSGIGAITSRSIAEQLGSEIVSSTTAQVSADVREYLGTAMRVSDLYERRIVDGALSTRDLETWEKPMFSDLAVHPDVASICFATVNGDCTWLLRAHDRLELGLVRGDARDRAIE